MAEDYEYDAPAEQTARKKDKPTGKHTPEPWMIGVGGKDDGARCLTVNAMTVYEVRTNHPHGAWASIWTRCKEDASRLVACVNACEGIPTEELESGVIEEMMLVLQALANRFDQQGWPKHPYGDMEGKIRSILARTKEAFRE